MDNFQIDQASRGLISVRDMPGHSPSDHNLADIQKPRVGRAKVSRRGQSIGDIQQTDVPAESGSDQTASDLQGGVVRAGPYSVDHWPSEDQLMNVYDAAPNHSGAETPCGHVRGGKNSSRHQKGVDLMNIAAEGDEDDRAEDCTRSSSVASSPENPVRHSSTDVHTDDADGTERPASGQLTTSEDMLASPSAIQSSDPVISQIVQMHRMRRRWLKARNSLILQGKAFGRALSPDGDKVAGSKLYESVVDGTCNDMTAVLCMTPFVQAADRFDQDLKKVEKDLIKLAKKLPVAPYVESVPGFGFGSLASIVGEAGDIGQYRSVSALWKRLGLAVIDGERQRRVSDADKAIAHGYSPERRSVMWNAGNGLIGGMGHGKRPFVDEDIELRDDWSFFERMFVHRLRYEAARDPENMGRPATKDPKTGMMRESFSAHASARAKRYTEKKFLLRLYAEWRRASAKALLNTVFDMPMPELIAAE